MSDRLDSREFAELCQQYRHAPDAQPHDGRLTAAQAFEALKGWIRGYVATVKEGK